MRKAKFNIELQKTVAFILLPLCRCFFLTMELVAAQVTAILTSLISSFVGVPMYGKISVSFIAEWHSTSCMEHRWPLLQSRFPAYPERLDTLSRIRHQSRNKGLSMLAHRLIHRRIGYQYSTLCKRELHACPQEGSEIIEDVHAASETGAKQLLNYKYPSNY